VREQRTAEIAHSLSKTLQVFEQETHCRRLYELTHPAKHPSHSAASL